MYHRIKSAGVINIINDGWHWLKTGVSAASQPN